MKKLTRKELTRKQAGSIKGGLACDELNDYSCPGDSICCFSTMLCRMKEEGC